MRLAHWVAIAGFVAGTTAADRVAQAGGENYALVWDDAELYTKPRADAAFVEVRPGKATRSLGHVFPAEVVGDKNGFVHIRTTSWGHCHRAFPATDMVLDLYVRPDAIADSTVKAETFRFRNGTEVRLSAGVHVVTTNGKPTVRLFRTHVALPRVPATGRYSPGRPLPSKRRTKTIDGRATFELGSAKFSRKYPSSRVAVIEQRGRDAVVELTGLCVRANVRTAAKHLRSAKEGALLGRLGGGVGGLGTGFGSSARFAKAKTVLYWKDGSRAGVARHQISFPAGDKGRVCNARNIARSTGGASSLEVCVDAKDLVKSKIASGGIGYGKGTGGRLGSIDVAGKNGRVGSVKTGRPSSQGRPRQQIMRVVASRKNAIRACYERELQRTKGIAGKVVVAWTIKPSGSVIKARVKSSSMRNGKVEDCIVRQVARMRFPKAKMNASITFPFIFASK